MFTNQNYTSYFYKSRYIHLLLRNTQAQANNLFLYIYTGTFCRKLVKYLFRIRVASSIDGYTQHNSIF